MHWSRKWCSTVLVLGIVIVIGAFALVMVAAIIDAVIRLNDDLPQIVDKVRHSSLGTFINGGSNSLDTLQAHVSDIATGRARCRIIGLVALSVSLDALSRS